MSLRHERFILKHLDVVTRSGDEFYCRCPFHSDTSPSFAINGKSGLWLCHGCHVKGNLESLASQIGVDTTKTASGVRDMLKELREEEEWEPEEVRVLPEAWLAQFDITHNYWDSRGLSKITQSAFGLGYDPFRDCVTVPLRSESYQLLGVLRRQLAKDAKPRYLYPRGFHAASNLFGSWLIDGHSTVALVEGTIDAMSCWNADIPALAIYGSRLSDSQMVLIRELGISTVVFMLDNDDAGVHGVTSAVSQGMNGIGWRVATDWPEGAKDPGDLENHQIRELYHSAQRLWHLQ